MEIVQQERTVAGNTIETSRSRLSSFPEWSSVQTLCGFLVARSLWPFDTCLVAQPLWPLLGSAAPFALPCSRSCHFRCFPSHRPRATRKLRPKRRSLTPMPITCKSAQNGSCAAAWFQEGLPPNCAHQAYQAKMQARAARLARTQAALYGFAACTVVRRDGHLLARCHWPPTPPATDFRTTTRFPDEPPRWRSTPQIPPATRFISAELRAECGNPRTLRPATPTT